MSNQDWFNDHLHGGDLAFTCVSRARSWQRDCGLGARIRYSPERPSPPPDEKFIRWCNGSACEKTWGSWTDTAESAVAAAPFNETSFWKPIRVSGGNITRLNFALSCTPSCLRSEFYRHKSITCKRTSHDSHLLRQDGHRGGDAIVGWNEQGEMLLDAEIVALRRLAYDETLLLPCLVSSYQLCCMPVLAAWHSHRLGLSPRTDAAVDAKVVNVKSKWARREGHGDCISLRQSETDALEMSLRQAEINASSAGSSALSTKIKSLECWTSLKLAYATVQLAQRSAAAAERGFPPPGNDTAYPSLSDAATFNASERGPSTAHGVGEVSMMRRSCRLVDAMPPYAMPLDASALKVLPRRLAHDVRLLDEAKLEGYSLAVTIITGAFRNKHNVALNGPDTRCVARACDDRSIVTMCFDVIGLGKPASRERLHEGHELVEGFATLLHALAGDENDSPRDSDRTFVLSHEDVARLYSPNPRTHFATETAERPETAEKEHTHTEQKERKEQKEEKEQKESAERVEKAEIAPKPERAERAKREGRNSRLFGKSRKRKREQKEQKRH